MKKLWQLAYEEYLGDGDNLEILELDRLIDSKLKGLLSEQDFNELYILTSKVQALIDENAFEAGFERGLRK